ncbi:MAG: hypothetical protein ABIO24_06510 [Saprospiraceae bacterium]
MLIQKLPVKKTGKHWQEIKIKLQSDPTPILWEEAFEDFLLKRITTRYYQPIEAISKIKIQQGKGFSIVSIYCSLIEFFEALKKGYEFRSDRKCYNILHQAESLVKSTRFGLKPI